MNDAEFEDVCERITNLLRFEGEEQAVAERDRINEQLAPEQNLHFQGPAGGNMLAFLCSIQRQDRREWREDKAHLG